jgi:hypothetical protein
LISLINDYSLFEATDSEIIQMLSTKLGKIISESLFYQLKKGAIKQRGDSDQWLDYFARYQYVEYYRKIMEDLEYVQRTLLKALSEEKEKPEDKKDKTLINQISKTIADNSKVLSEFGMAPPILSRIKSLISENYSPINNQVDGEIKRIQLQRQNIKSGLYLKMDNEDNSREINESQRVF